MVSEKVTSKVPFFKLNTENSVTYGETLSLINTLTVVGGNDGTSSTASPTISTTVSLVNVSIQLAILVHNSNLVISLKSSSDKVIVTTALLSSSE